MNRTRWIAAVAMAGVAVSFVREAASEEAGGCQQKITRSNVAVCAVRASLALQAEHEGAEALEGRRVAASPLLPSNPVLSFSAAHRSASGRGQTATNWYGTLTQEIEVAGQRGARRNAVDASISAQDKRVFAARRSAALDAWSAFFDASAAEEERRLAERLASVVETVAVVARGRANEGLLSSLDADVAETSSLRLSRARFDAERRAAESKAALASLLGRDPLSELVVEDDLAPLARVSELTPEVVQNTIADRPDVQAAQADERAQELRATMLRRSRVPNPSLSGYVHNDGFDERVIGIGIAVPIPLPGPVGRTYAGEISEAEALARRARIEMERRQREARLEVAMALAAYQSRQRELQTFTPQKLQSSQESLRLLSQEIQAGRINVRDALIAQQALIEFIQAELTARRELARASVDLVRASGISVEGSDQ